MNLKKRIGQLMVVGFQGLEPSDDFLKFVEEWGIGGFIFFARNIDRAERIPQVVRRLEDAAGGPIFTSIDQEGGLVMRILTSGSPFPGAMALSATDDVDLTRKIHTAIGREMRALNLNWNLAPVLDINHRDNPGIGARSFGEDPERVSRFGCAAVEGLQAGGVLACAKHFPGKGHARVDSHLTLPTIPYDTARLESFELQPFRAAIRSGVASIMTSHVFFPAYESTPNLPATLSKAVLTDLLRGKLGFTGLLVTDDLEMGAITEAYGVAEAGFRSFMAGADLLLICHDLDRERSCAEKILDECRHNPDVEKRIEESLTRISSARTMLQKPVSCSTNLDTLTKEHQPLIDSAYQRSLLYHRVSRTALPFSPQTPKTFFCPEISALVQVEESLAADGIGSFVRSIFPHARIGLYPPKGSASEILARWHSLCPEPKAAGDIVVFSYNAHLFAGQRDGLNDIARQAPQSVLCALRNPYDVTACNEFSTAAATFGFRSPAIRTFLHSLTRAHSGHQPWPFQE